MISPEIWINKPHFQPIYPWYKPNSWPGEPKKRSGRFGKNIFPILGFRASIGLYYPVFRTPELGWHYLLSHSTMEHIFSQQYFSQVSSHLAWNTVRMPATDTWCMVTLFPTFLFPVGQRSGLFKFPPTASPPCTYLSQWTQALSLPFYGWCSVYSSHSQQLAAWKVSKHKVTTHTATQVFLFTAQVYFLDLASQLNHPIIGLSSKLSGKMRVATYG